MKKIVFVIIALTALASLTACSQVRSKPTAAVLPDVIEYPKAVQAKAAAEMRDNCDAMPVVCDLFMPDYKVMRDQTRAAKAILK